jgi:predicted secreted acid phosphatase
MFMVLAIAQRMRAQPCFTRIPRNAGVAVIMGAMIAIRPAVVFAYDCPPPRQPSALPITEISQKAPDNIDGRKQQLKEYQKTNYELDIAAVISDARAYIERRASQVRKPALVLDIDETSLSNWQNLLANDFGFIPDGPCNRLPSGPCGFNDWKLNNIAPAIAATKMLFDAAIEKGVAVIFITGRRDSERKATMWNLDRAGFEGWAKLITRPDSDTDLSIIKFKSGARKKMETEDHYTIIANVGDQESDLAGEVAECKFKMPNPFYYIP